MSLLVVMSFLLSFDLGLCVCCELTQKFGHSALTYWTVSLLYHLHEILEARLVHQRQWQIA